MVKKLIKHSTCRHRLTGKGVEHRSYAGSSDRRWKQTFTKGYIQQAFTRTCVREAIRHGEENAAYLQRVDAIRAMRRAWPVQGSVSVTTQENRIDPFEQPPVLWRRRKVAQTIRLALSRAAWGGACR